MLRELILQLNPVPDLRWWWSRHGVEVVVLEAVGGGRGSKHGRCESLAPVPGMSMKLGSFECASEGFLLGTRLFAVQAY